MVKKFCLLFCLAVVLTGCTQNETLLTIKKNGSGLVEQKIYVETKKKDESKVKVTNDLKPKIARLENDTKLKFETFENEVFQGLKGKRTIRDFREDEWNSKLETEISTIKTNNADYKIVSVQKGFFVTKYTIDCEIEPIADTNYRAEWATLEEEPVAVEPVQNNVQTDLENPQDEQTQPSEEELTYEARKEAEKQMQEQLKANIKSVFSIKTPVRASSHNSTNVDTKKLIYSWDLPYGEFTSVKLKFAVYNIVNIITTIILMLIIIGELYYLSNKQGK